MYIGTYILSYNQKKTQIFNFERATRLLKFYVIDLS